MNNAIQGGAERVRVAARTVHMGLSVRGALNWPKSRLKGWLRDADGRLLTPDQARAALMDELAQGREVLPVGDCDAWDFKTGCPGHPVADASFPKGAVEEVAG